MTIEKTELKLLLKALTFATLKHKDQRRKDADASPYINHPISLANILCNEGLIADIETICGALLHSYHQEMPARRLGRMVLRSAADACGDHDSP